MWVIVVLGIIAFLLMEHTVAFWLVFVPLALLFVLSILYFLKNQRAGLSDLLTIIVILAGIVVALVAIVSI